jgi:hypothetical protein
MLLINVGYVTKSEIIYELSEHVMRLRWRFEKYEGYDYSY